jgi:hypothetical protein
VVGDHSFIELPPAWKQIGFLIRLPTSELAWYAHPVAECTLHNNRLRLGDVKLSLQASSHVLPTCLHTVLDTIAQDWPQEESQLQSDILTPCVRLWTVKSENTFHVNTNKKPEAVRMSS